MSGSTTVPTMDAFNAVVSKVDALNTRVTALEHGAPPVPPNPVKPPSADGTTVANTTGEIVDGKHRTFKLTGPASNYQISTDGQVSGGMVVRLYAKGQLCYQENVNHDWWVMPLAATTHGDDNWVGCPNPTGVAPPIPPIPPVVAGVPAAAAAVGFTKLTHGPDVTLGKNWFPVPGGSQNVSQQPDGSVLDRGPTDQGAWHYNDHFGTDHNLNGGFGGLAFGGGGYFEVTMSIQNRIKGWCNPGSDPNCKGWPAWWSNSVEGDYGIPNNLPDGMGIEYDAAEFLDGGTNKFSAGIILWNGSGGNYNNSQAGQGNGFTGPANFNFAEKHRYGWLWVAATDTTQGYIKNYMDGVQFGRTYTWSKYKGGNWEQTKSDPWSPMDMGHHRLMLGTGPENPMTVYSVAVWQKDDSHNIRRGVPLPG